jgi:phosphatidylserine/phosphatidylglycerophosphate/cardiolipin synthase-like enzyme
MSVFRIVRVAAGLALLVGAGMWSGLFQSCNMPVVVANPLSSIMSSHDEAVHYAPAENLERVDLQQLAEAKGHLDIAMYAFTDKSIARELVQLSDLGIVIRLYRDGDQYQQEEARGDSTTDILRGHPNIQIRVKHGSRQNLMHLKAFCDGTVLRDGSANWSISGLLRQDNSVTVTNNSREVESFERLYDDMWQRNSNLVVQ